MAIVEAMIVENGNNGKNDSGDDSKTDDNESDFGGGIIIR